MPSLMQAMNKMPEFGSSPGAMQQNRLIQLQQQQQQQLHALQQLQQQQLAGSQQEAGQHSPLVVPSMPSAVDQARVTAATQAAFGGGMNKQGKHGGGEGGTLFPQGMMQGGAGGGAGGGGGFTIADMRATFPVASNGGNVASGPMVGAMAVLPAERLTKREGEPRPTEAN